MNKTARMLIWITQSALAFAALAADASDKSPQQGTRELAKALATSVETAQPLELKGQSGPLLEGLDLNQAGSDQQKSTTRTEQRPTSLDEGCLPPDSLVIKVLPGVGIELRWPAPQSGLYRIYATSNTNPAAPPSSPDWVKIDSVSVAAPGVVTRLDAAPADPYRNYVVTHECTPPANDYCADAPLVGDGVHYYSTINANTDGPNISCASPGVMQHDVWFRYVATCAVFSVYACDRPDIWDNLIAVYEGWDCPTTQSDIACVDDYCFGWGAALTVQAVVGQQYLIRIGGFGADMGTGYMRIAPGAANNDCERPQALVGYPTWTVSRDFTNICATTDGPIETFQNGSPRLITGDLWYELASAACGICTVRTCGSGFDTQIAVYDSNLCPINNNTAEVTNDDGCALQSRLTFYVDSENRYLIRVGGYNGATGSGNVTIVMPTPPSNDLCDNPLVVGLGDTPYSTINACTDGPLDVLNCRPDHDIWFETSMGLCGFLDIDVCDADYDTWIAVYEGNDCNNLGDPVACNDDNQDCPGDLQSKLRFYPSSSGPYLIRVGGYEGFIDLGFGTGVLSISQGFVSYVNETCASSVPLAYGSHTLRNSCANTDGDAVTCGQIYNDLWYTINPPTNSSTTISLCGSEIDTRLAVYYAFLSPACDNLTLVACGDNECGDDASVTFNRGGIGLGVYLLRVGSNATFEEGEIQVSIVQN